MQPALVNPFRAEYMSYNEEARKPFVDIVFWKHLFQMLPLFRTKYIP